MDEQVITAWATRFRDGDERSFRRLVDALTRTLIAMAYRYTGDWEWARDLTQETWIRVHQQIHRYDSTRSFVTWLHTVHRNGCLDHARRAWTRRESPYGADALARLGGEAPEDPARDVERREFHEQVLQAAAGLSESQRQVFVRVDLEQGEQTQVARDLGIRPGTLRTTLHFARRKVAEALNALEEGT
ncbi:MAG TPA: RNA polymerase sigma factor [Longimicrobiales bacterium]|nr:RNA polymerase sigma factor [Longimicrobiales bacterium]